MPTTEPAEPRYSTLASCEEVTSDGERSASDESASDDCDSSGTTSAVEGEHKAFLHAPPEGNDLPGILTNSRKKKNWSRWAILGSFLLLAAVVAVGQAMWHTWTVDHDRNSNPTEAYDNFGTAVHYNWNGKKCFESNWELTVAVDAYLLDPTNATLEQLYGWPIGVWCTQYVQDFSFLFAVDRNDELSEQLKVFNDDISGWDTSSVVSLDGTFRGTEEFNQDLKWDTRNVVTMRGTFAFTRRFDGGTYTTSMSFTCLVIILSLNANLFWMLDIRGWDVSKVHISLSPRHTAKVSYE